MRTPLYVRIFSFCIPMFIISCVAITFSRLPIVQTVMIIGSGIGIIIALFMLRKAERNNG